MKFKTEKISFVGSLGHMMDGRLELPELDTKSYAIFAHCFTCSKDIHAATRISRALTRVGVGVLRFDFTGIGNSDGDFSNTNFSTNVADLVCAYKYLVEHFAAPEILIGHSLGGAAVLSSTSSMPSIKVVAAIAAPSDVAHIEAIFGDKIHQIEKEGQAEVTLAGRSFTIKKQFINDVRSISIENKIQTLNASLLIFHSPEDKVIPVTHAYQIFQSASYPKSLICLNGASHVLDRAEDSEYVSNIISNWCFRYLLN
jgi:esterase/lipase